MLSGRTGFLVSCSLISFAAMSVEPFEPVQDATSVAAGRHHACLVTLAGGVQCWGQNIHGQLGDGSNTHRVTPDDVAGLSVGVAGVAAGAEHACALRSSGTVACWGRNDAGQLGNDGTTGSNVPVEVVGLTGVTLLSVGARHSCAVAAGEAWCWGANATGQLGNGNTEASDVPVKVAVLLGVSALDAGTDHTCAVHSSGKAACWGANADGQLGNGGILPSPVPTAVTGLAEGVTAVAAGGTHSCALIAAGGLRCWGRNAEYQLGDGSQQPSLVPVVVQNVVDALAMDAGRAHTCALRADHSVWCWGDSNQDQLSTALPPLNLPRPALQSAYASNTPVKHVVQLSMSHDLSCAAFDNGGARCWGANVFGQRGTGYAMWRLDAVRVARLGSGTLDVQGAGDFACALDTAGSVRCWGSNGEGFIREPAYTLIPIPVRIDGLDGVSSLRVSAVHSCAIAAGVLKCWGGLGNGETGTGDWGPVPVPTVVTGMDAPVESVAVSLTHSCAVTVAGAAWCFGQGPTGNAAAESSYTPVPVAGLSSGVREMALGFSHRCALLDDGSVKCWGTSPATIGDGSGVAQKFPVPIGALQGGVRAISAGLSHTCALMETGRVKCWGNNASGQLGDGSTTTRPTPVDVSGLENVTAIFAGRTVTCAILDDGDARCWGDGRAGALGNGTLASSLVPVDVTVWNEPFADMTVAGTFTCAVSMAGETRCWGANNYEQLGEHRFTNVYAAPVRRWLGPVDLFDFGFEYE